MKRYVADLYFDHDPASAAFVRATAEAFGVAPAEVVEGWFLGDDVRTAYENPGVKVVLLRNYEQDGPFPRMYGVAVEEPSEVGEPLLAARFAAITRKLAVAAVMPVEYGRLRLFGPDGSDRLVIRDEDDDDEFIRLIPADQSTLDRAYQAIGAVAS